ncbi:penicillin-binding transpeptidase domain-containing protein [Hathewaya limosa]|uniref:Penicillin-binding protein 2 n=1 Tax=Hathewaya limosa TaxID=1536 RepID=A0ABU0JTX3_HATLI|nr:penicillin-binding transpeptidase domain-containing protein [Hathewaya limosa]MDQ0479514.1 penicillin-binding protein 2 [Hathewaya limosa]
MKKKKKAFNRFYGFTICLIFIYTAIVSRLFYLQVIKGDYFSEKANSNTHKMILKSAPRGEITDKNGKILATSRQSFMLIFTETEESKKEFYNTMEKVFNILKENKSTIEDDFPLKIEPFRFEFNVSAESAKRWNENRFKKDRGIDEFILKTEFPGKKKEDLTKEQNNLIDKKINSISAEEVFDNLITDKSYKIYDLAKENYIKEQWKSVTDKDSIDEEKWTKEISNKWDGLEKSYKVQYLHSKYNLKTIRDYMVIKDKIKMQSFSGYKPVVIANDLSEELAYIFEQLQSDLPGISIIKQPIREYPNGDLGSSILGYIRKINSNEQSKYEEKGYDVSSDYIGAAGIEEKYEDILKGTKGQESIETNKYGRKVKTLGEQTPYPGNNIELTIDKDIQKIAEKALDDKLAFLRKLKDRKPSGEKDDANKVNATRGAAVVLNVKTSAVLALVSRPGYDPNLFTTPGKLSPEEYKKYFNPDLKKFGEEYIKRSELLGLKEFNGEDISKLSDSKKMDYLLNKLFPLSKGIEGNTTLREDNYDLYPKPFYNYATKSLIPPGSIFKPVTSVAGLEEKVITADTRIYDAGPYNKRYKQFRGASWKYNLYKSSHGNQNLKEALRDSNNYYMFDIADRLFAKGGVETKEGLNMIAKYAWQLGLGADPENSPNYSTGIELDENFGQVYNYETGKRTLTVVYTQKLYDYLQNGTASIWGIKYKGIDIVPRDKEDSKVNETKKKLTEEIKKEMSSKNKGLIGSNIKKLLSQLINISPELKKKSYTSKDLDSMIEAIQASVNDARGEIKSGTNAYNASIGQGLNQFTPLQIANYVATLVNGGNRNKVHMINKITDPEGKVIKDYSKEPQVLGKTTISKATVDSVKLGMKEVSEGGTASSVFKDFPITNGGKTGSATFSNTQDEIGRTSYGNFVGFAPYDDPEIAVVVMLFDGGHGSYAADVVKAIYEQYFKEQLLKQNSNYKFKYPDITVPEKIKKEKEEKDKKAADKSKEISGKYNKDNTNKKQNTSLKETDISNSKSKTTNVSTEKEKNVDRSKNKNKVTNGDEKSKSTG